MHASNYYRVNAPTVIHETIDGEVIVANLDEGFYYSIEKLGVAVWNAMVDGASATTISRALAQHYNDHAAEIEPAVAEFFAGLVAQNLIVPAPEIEKPAEQSRIEQGEPTLTLPKLPANYTAPSFQKYTDMQQLLLLDPIHEVDETGWPNVVPEKVNK